LRRRAHKARLRLLLTATLLPLAAVAQRVDDNAVTAADDAFGTTVGAQTIGLYDTDNVRGFSPKNAGNLRIEGLYFDQQTFEVNRCLIGEQSVRVGLAAQAYNFPAPTGIANFSLRDAAPDSRLSVVADRGPFDASSVELDGHYGPAGAPVSANVCWRRAVNADFEFSRNMQGNDYGLILGSELPHDLQLITFAGLSEGKEHKELPFVYTEGTQGVPNFRHMQLPTQDWTRWRWDDRTYGAILRTTESGAWSLDAGVFRSVVDNPQNYNDLFLDVAPDRTALHEFDVLPPLYAASTSGEMRLAYRSGSATRQDQWSLMLRGRDVKRSFGGDSITDLGRVSIDDYTPVPEPPVVFTAGSEDRVRQLGFGLEYDANWPGRGSVGIGAQHVNYQRSIDAPGAPTATDRSAPVLPTFRFTAEAAKQLLFYGSYTRGLEDSALAPASAVNRGESPPATTTWQVDAGVRYAPRDGAQFLLGAFEVHKANFSLNADDVYTQLGQIRNRGLEASATLSDGRGLVAVLGGVWLQAQLLGVPVDAASPGTTPLGAVPLVVNADLDYAPARLKPWALGCHWQFTSARPATTDGNQQLPAYSVLSLTVRYAFTLFGHPALARFEAQNVGDANGMIVDDSGTVMSLQARAYALTLTADF
jgi:iron complex outermembrane receptor protein